MLLDYDRLGCEIEDPRDGCEKGTVGKGGSSFARAEGKMVPVEVWEEHKLFWDHLAL